MEDGRVVSRGVRFKLDIRVRPFKHVPTPNSSSLYLVFCASGRVERRDRELVQLCSNTHITARAVSAVYPYTAEQRTNTAGLHRFRISLAPPIDLDLSMIRLYAST